MITANHLPPYRLFVFATHPVQYQVPWFRAMAADSRIDLTVFFASLHGAREAEDPGFGIKFKWDIPLLEGYTWRLMPNRAGRPAVNTFWGTNVPEMDRLINKERPDACVIPGWGRRFYLQAARACVSCRVPLLMRGEARLAPEEIWLSRHLRRIFIAPLVKRCTALLCIGQANRAFYRWCGVQESQLFDTPYFVDNDFFATHAAGAQFRRAWIRQRWKLPKDGFVFLFVGKFIPKKRPLDLILALDVIRRRQGAESQSISALLVGDGMLRKECERVARQKGLPLSFVGFLNQTEIPEAYCAADCLVLPSDHGETWGLVVNEAMACGLPAIVSDRVGCADDLVKEGVTGYKFPMGDVDGLATRMLQIACSTPLVRRLGAAAYDRVRGYTVEAAVEGTILALHSMDTKNVC